MSGGLRKRRNPMVAVPEALYTDSRLSDRAVRLWCLMDLYGEDSESIVRERGAIDLDCSRGEIDQAVAELREAGWVE